MLKHQLIEQFIALGAFRWDTVQGFRLASGQISPYYVDCRALLAHPQPRRLVAQLALAALEHVEVDCVGGLEIGAIPLATAISDFALMAAPPREWRTFVVRKQPKDHGLGKLVEGSAQPNRRALIVDDVLTSGNSVLRAIEAARKVGMVVTHALVIVDRQEQQGRLLIEGQHVNLLSLLTLDDLKQAFTKPSG